MSRRDELISNFTAQLLAAWHRDRHTWPANTSIDIESFAVAFADQQLWEEGPEGQKYSRDKEMEVD